MFCDCLRLLIVTQVSICKAVSSIYWLLCFRCVDAIHYRSSCPLIEWLSWKILFACIRLLIGAGVNVSNLNKDCNRISISLLELVIWITHVQLLNGSLSFFFFGGGEVSWIVLLTVSYVMYTWPWSVVFWHVDEMSVTRSSKNLTW